MERKNRTPKDAKRDQKTPNARENIFLLRSLGALALQTSPGAFTSFFLFS
jgi:hypothetical protein